MDEVWLPVREFPEHYAVSSLGRVRRVKSVAHAPIKGDGIRKPVINKVGYAQYMLWKDGKQYMRDGHRLVADAFHGPIPPKMHVNHKNGMKADNRAENLEICTISQNHIHACHVLGIMPPNIGKKGQDNNKAVLTWEEVCAIREGYAAGHSNMQELADHYKTTKQTVWRIIHRKVRSEA